MIHHMGKSVHAKKAEKAIHAAETEQNTESGANPAPEHAPAGQNAAPFGRLMLSMFKIGCVGFGGGSALIPVIEREVVQDQQIVTQEEYDKNVVVACVTPGALPVEIATGLGKDAYGIRGMLCASLLMAVPGVVMLLVILSVLASLDKLILTQMQCLSIGLCAFISCLLTQYAIASMREAKKDNEQRLRRAVVIMIGVFLLACGSNLHTILGLESTPLFALSTIQILGLAFFGIFYTHCKFTKKNTIISVVLIGLYILCAGKAQIIPLSWLKYILIVIMCVLAVEGLIRSMRTNKKENVLDARSRGKHLIKELIVWILFLVILSIPALILCKAAPVYLVRGLLSSYMSFGGGDAYLSVADGMFVQTEMIAKSVFYSRLASVANILPGSILCKILAGIGYYLGYNQTGSFLVGFLVALCGLAVSVMGSGSVFCIIDYVYTVFSEVVVFKKISKWIRPIISGLLLSVMLSMFTQNMESGSGIGFSAGLSLLLTAVIYAVNMLFLLKWGCGNGILIIISAGLGLLLCNLALIML